MKPLKPVMAALLAASSATFALPGISYGQPAKSGQAASEDCSSGVNATDPINALTCLIRQKPEALKDIGERLARFLSSKDDAGRPYLAAELQANASVLAQARLVAKAWPEANKDKPQRIAYLYYVVGPDDAVLPPWAQTPYLTGVFKPGMRIAKRLPIYLDRNEGWTGASPIEINSEAKGPIGISGVPGKVQEFLEVAADEAKTIYDDQRSTGVVVGSADTNKTDDLHLPKISAPSQGSTGSGSGFGFNDLYGEPGAKVENVYGPNDDGYRTLSMKIYSTKNEDGSVVNQVGIVDITAGDITSPTLPKFIDVSQPGKSDIVLRDGGRHYTVVVDNSGNVTLSRAGASPDGSGSMSTTKQKLSDLRNAQIMTCGQTMIGGKPFYVLAQGGAKGSTLFFSQDQMQSLSGGTFPKPELMADVTQVDGQGETVPVTGKPDLGTLPDESQWHLEFDFSTKMWKVASGQGDVNDDSGDDPPAGSGGKGGKSGKGSSGGSSDSSGSSDGSSSASTGGSSDSTTLDQVISLAKAAGWKEVSKSGLDKATLAQVRIATSMKKGEKQYAVLFAPKFKVNGNQWVVGLTTGERLIKVRALKKYIVLNFESSTMYYAPQNLANFINSASGADLAGTYTVSNGQMSNVVDEDVLRDILAQSMNAQSEDIDKIVGVLEQHVPGDSGYTVSGDLKALILAVGDARREIWPEDKPAADSGTNAGMTDLKGPGTAVNVSGGGAVGFPKTMDMTDGTATRVQTADHAAMYSTDVPSQGDSGTPATVYSVMFEYKNQSGALSRSKPFPMFGGDGRLSRPSGLHLAGLPDKQMSDSAVLMMQYGSTQESGAIAAYRNVAPDAQGGSNVKDKKDNCGGPVVWWGDVTKAEVQKACEGDSKIR